jgi:hypothetical protein
MQPDELIASYVADVAGKLPIRMRGDVALELRSLLQEQLQARSAAAGRAPDAAMTVAMLQAFGHPERVAARYHPQWAIIDPGDTRNFVLAAVVGGALLVAASVPTALLHPERYRGPEAFLVWWLGALVLYFGLKSWALRRYPKQRAWNPHSIETHQPKRLGSVVLALLICAGVVAYGAPQWLYAQLSGGRQLAHWLDYDAAFRLERLPWLLALWTGQGVLFLVAAIRGRWTSRMRWLNRAFSLGAMAVLAWFIHAGRLFVESVPNESALAFARAFLFVMLIDMGVKIYREVAGGRVPDLSASRVDA